MANVTVHALTILLYFAAILSAHKINRRNSKKNCGQPSANAPKVQICRYMYDQNQLCSFPSSPRNLISRFEFNKSKRIFRLIVSWDAPKYGLQSLWGYEVILNHKCYQINIKGKKGGGTFIFPGHFSYEDEESIYHHNLLISSLPRLSRNYTNSIEKVVKLPDECNTFAKHGIKDSVDCVPIKNTTVHKNCVVGFNNDSIVKFPWPKSKYYDGIEFLYMANSCSTGSNIRVISLVRNDSVFGFFTITSMVKNCNYTLWATAFRNDRTREDIRKYRWQKQLTVWCLDPSLSTKAVHKKTVFSNKALLLTLATVGGILALVVVPGLIFMKKKKMHHYGKNKHGDITGNTEPVESSQSNSPIVMIIWSHGCKSVEDFVIIFASFLYNNGLTVKLDLLENNAIAEFGGMANYLLHREETADFVVIICSGSQDNSFKFILDVMKNKVMNTGSKSRYIPVYFERGQLQNVPIWLQGVSHRVPENIEQIVQLMHNIKPYEMNVRPLKNTIIVDKWKVAEVKTAVDFVLKPRHIECNDELCEKGVHVKLHQMSDAFSTNSFKEFDYLIQQEVQGSFDSILTIAQA